MARQKRLFILPELKKTKNRNNQVWYIEYSFRCAKTDRMIRKRISKPFDNTESNDHLLEIANPIIEEISKKLKQGWTPDDDNKLIYNDVVEYHQTAKMYGRKRKSNRSVRNMVSKFLETKNDCRKSTLQNYTVKLRNLTVWCETNGFKDLDITSITNSVMLDYFQYLKEEKKLDPATIKYYKTMMWSFFNWIEKNHNINENPVFNIEIPRKTTDFAARPILQHDVIKLLDLMEKGDPQLYLACLFQYYTAIRPHTELRLLKIKDIDFQNCSVTIHAEHAKNNKTETIDLSESLRDICVKNYQLHTFNTDYYVFGNIGMPGKNPISKNNMRERFNKFRDALNLPKYYKYYSFKHTGAGKLLNSGASIEEVRNHLRHSSIETTHHYSKKHFGERNMRVIKDFPDPRS